MTRSLARSLTMDNMDQEVIEGHVENTMYWIRKPRIKMDEDVIEDQVEGQSTKAKEQKQSDKENKKESFERIKWA